MSVRQIMHLVEARTEPIILTFDNFDLTGFTVSLRVARDDGARFTRIGVVDDVGPVNAQVTVTFNSGDLTPGDHESEIKLEGPGGAVSRSPKVFTFILRVRANLE